MKPVRTLRLQVGTACLAIAGYAVLAHHCNALGRADDLAAVVAIAPASAIALMLIWRRTAAVAITLTVALSAALYVAWPLLKHSQALVCLIQESGMYGLLALTFLQSLMPGRIAVCTRLADRVHGPLSSLEVSYTRWVTLLWSLLFLAICTISVVLFLAAPLPIWSIYVNFCVLPLVGIMFAVEYWMRQRVLPQTPRTGLLAAVRVYIAASQRS